MSRVIKCFKSAIFASPLMQQRIVFLENFRADRAAEAAKSLETALEKREKVASNKDFTDFLKQNPQDTVGGVEMKNKELTGSTNEKTKGAVTAVDEFIDELVGTYKGSETAKSLFERDLIASYQSNGGVEKIRKVIGMKSLKIDKVQVEVVGGQIMVIGRDSKGDKNYFMMEFPMKSEIRERAEKKYSAIINESKKEIAKTEAEVVKTPATPGGAPAAAPPTQEGATAPTEEHAEDKADIAEKEGAEREKAAKEDKEQKETADKAIVYTPEQLDAIIHREVYLEKGVYQHWSGVDVPTAEAFNQITNSESMRALISEEPFGWSPGQLHKAVQDGNNQIVELDDLIDEEGLGLMDDNDFIKEYTKMAEEVKAGTATPDTLEKLQYYNQVIAQGLRILDALEPKNFKYEEGKKENTSELAYQDMLGQAKTYELASTDAKPPKVDHYYSFAKLQSSKKVIAQGDYEEEQGKTAIGVDANIFQSWKEELVNNLKDFLKEKYKKGEYGKDKWGFERSKIDRMEEVTLLRLLASVYGYKELIAGGYLTKFQGKEGDKLVLTSIPSDFKAGNPKFDALFKSIEWKQAGFMDNAFVFDDREAGKQHLEKADDSVKVDSYLKKIFDKNHIGELVDGGSGQIMDITLADGVHSTIYKDQFKAYLTGESAYTNSKDEIWRAAEVDAAADGKGREAFGQYTVEKTVTLINAYIDLGNLNSQILFGGKKEVPKITADDIYNQNISEEQIKAAQMGSTVEWTQAAKFDVLEDLRQDKPALYAVTRQLFWNNPGISVEKQRAIVDAIKKIDLGTIVAYFKTDQHGTLDTWGAGYNYPIPVKLPYGLALSVSVGGFQGKESSGAVVGAGVGGSHQLGENGKYGKINWNFSAGAGFTSLGTGPFVAASVSYDFEVSDAYDLSVGAFAGTDFGGVKAGLTFGAKADVQRSYNRQLAEKYEKLGFNELNAILRNPGIPIEQKALAIENNLACGPLMKKMVTVFEEMQEKFGRKVSPEMRQDLLLQTYNTITTNLKMDHDENWSPEFLNSIGITLEINPNLFSTFEALLGGLISINIKGKTYCIPVAPQGIPSTNEGILTKQLMNNLRARLAKQQGIDPANVEITPAILSQEGLLVRTAGPNGFEYRAVNAQEVTGTAELTKKDETYEAVQEAFDDAHIAFNRDSDPTSFTMDVKNYGNQPLTDANVVLSVDPKLRPYIDVIGDKQNRFKVRFKEGFKQFGRLLVSRQDIVSPMRNAGAPKLVKIMLKADTTHDSTLEQLNDYTGLYKYNGSQVREKGSKSKENNLWTNIEEYQADLAKGTAGKFLQLNEKDLTEAEIQKAAQDQKTIQEHRQLWGIEAPKMRPDAELDGIVTGYLKELAKSNDSHYKELYRQIISNKLATQAQTDSIMEGLQKYAKENGKGELNEYELEYTKNLFSLHTFTNVTKYYVEGGESEAMATNKLVKLQKILRKRINLFGRIADQVFSGTSEGFDPKVRREMVKYLKNRMLQKVDNLTIEDIKVNNLKSINRDSLGQFLGSMAGRLIDVKQGRLADLDTYGTISPDDAQDMMAYGIEALNPTDKGIEGKVARAIIEIEYPHHKNLEGREFLNQPLSVQVGINAEKFFTAKEVAQLDQIKKGAPVTPELQPTFNKFKELVNMIGSKQIGTDIASIPDLGPKYKHAGLVIMPIKVKDFFFQQCGNHSWGVDAGIQFFAAQEQERPVFAGSMVKGLLGIGTNTQVSYYTIGIGVFGERKVQETPYEKDFRGKGNTGSTEGKDGEPTATGTAEPEGTSTVDPGTPTAAAGKEGGGLSDNASQPFTGTPSTPEGSTASTTAGVGGTSTGETPGPQ